MSSPTSSATPAEIIGRILNTDTGTPGYLQQLVTNIDTLLDQYTNKRKQTATDDKLSLIRTALPSPADVAAFSEEASKNVKLISDQISQSSGDKHSTAVSVLNAIGNVHWVGVGFLLVAAVIQRLDKMKQNKACLGLLKSMNNLAKLILLLQHIPDSKEEMNDKMEESIQLIVYGVISCCTQKKSKFLLRSHRGQLRTPAIENMEQESALVENEAHADEKSEEEIGEDQNNVRDIRLEIPPSQVGEVVSEHLDQRLQETNNGVTSGVIVDELWKYVTFAATIFGSSITFFELYFTQWHSLASLFAVMACLIVFSTILGVLFYTIYCKISNAEQLAGNPNNSVQRHVFFLSLFLAITIYVLIGVNAITKFLAARNAT